MTVLQDIETFFVDFAEDFIRDVNANGGNVLTAVVQTAVEATEQAFLGRCRLWRLAEVGHDRGWRESHFNGQRKPVSRYLSAFWDQRDRA